MNVSSVNLIVNFESYRIVLFIYEFRVRFEKLDLILNLIFGVNV